MAVHIRLRRMGKKKRPYYRIVAADSRRARNGRFLEILGTYNPITKPAEVKLFEDRISQWLNDGALPSDTVKSLFRQVGFTDKYVRAQKGEDVSEVAVKTTISERPKKTRRMKKASVAADEAAAEPKQEAAVEAAAEPKQEAADEAAAEPKQEAADEAAAEPKQEAADEATAEPKQDAAVEAAAESKQDAAVEPEAEAKPAEEKPAEELGGEDKKEE